MKKKLSVLHHALQLGYSVLQKKLDKIFSLICFKENIMFDVSVLLETPADSDIPKKKASELFFCV